MPLSRARCPFYGMHPAREMKVFVWSQGNQCGLITSAYSPCSMEIAGNAPDWTECGFRTGRKDPLVVLDGWSVFPRLIAGESMPFEEWFKRSMASAEALPEAASEETGV